MLSYELVCTSVGGFSQGQAPWAASVVPMENTGFFQGCNGSTHAGAKQNAAQMISSTQPRGSWRPTRFQHCNKCLRVVEKFAGMAEGICASRWKREYTKLESDINSFASTTDYNCRSATPAFAVTANTLFNLMNYKRILSLRPGRRFVLVAMHCGIPFSVTSSSHFQG